METDERLTTIEAAAILGIRPATLRMQVKNRRLTPVPQRGRDHFFLRSEIERYGREILRRSHAGGTAGG